MVVLMVPEQGICQAAKKVVWKVSCTAAWTAELKASWMDFQTAFEKADQTGFGKVAMKASMYVLDIEMTILLMVVQLVDVMVSQRDESQAAESVILQADQLDDLSDKTQEEEFEERYFEQLLR